MRKVYLSLILSCFCFLAQRTIAQTSTFNFTTGVVQIYTVPAGASKISIDMSGGTGGGGVYNVGGAGGRLQVTMNVTPAQVYSVYVGNVGQNTGPRTGVFGANGFPGHVGGDGENSGYPSGGGGGATEIWNSGGVVAVAGAGGGGSGQCTSDHGGLGGGAVAGNGLYCGAYNSSNCGTGGNTTTNTPGQAGSCGGASNGAQYIGGNPAPGCCSWASGGGAGYWGGGGGCGQGAGGGGSSYPATAGGSITAVSHTVGFNNSGAGTVVITVLCNAPGTVTGANTVCAGATTTFANATAGATGTWSSSNTTFATVDVNSGVVTGVAAGTATITYNVSSVCGGVPAVKTITVNPLPNPITGTLSTCTGATTTLSSGPGAGTWISTNTTVATIGSSSGLATGATSGTSTISFTLATGCAPATAVLTVNTQPAAIGGPSSVCGSQTISLSDATAGGGWTTSNSLLATATSGGIITGVGAGNPTVTYTLPTGCFSTYPITVNALSAIGGVPSMCLGNGTTLTDATPGGVWSSGNTAVATVGSSTGIVSSVALGSATISYAIIASGCTATISAAVTTVPNVYTVSGGGSLCPGGTPVTIFLNNSDPGVSYQLFNGAFPVGAPITGSGLIIAFPPVSAGGVYGVIANQGTACQTTMSGTATVTVLPAPTAFVMSGGGGYCQGGTGVHIFLNNSTIGINYQLFVGLTPVGGPVAGTGAPLDFGLKTTAGIYTIVGTNTSTGCTGPMSNGDTITVNPLPSLSTVTPIAGGGYCTGSGGSVVVGLNGSVTGTSYQLMLSGSPVGSAVAGTNFPITFGAQSTPGVYTVVGTTGLGCSATMTGSTTITVNPLPTVFTVTGGGSYCSGGLGLPIGLNGSTAGVNYQVFYTPLVGPTVTVNPAVAGTGVALNLGTFTNAGSYTVVATNTTTGCVSNMSGSVAVSLNPLPGVFTVSGGGTICAGSTGTAVGLLGSSTGTTYQLILNGGGIVGGAAGTGFPVSFGLQTGAGTYTVSATITATGCNVVFPSSVNIVVNPLPVATNVTAGGVVGGTAAFCALGTGVHVGLNGATAGISYQLYNTGVAQGAAVVPVSSGPLDFGLVTLAGTYTVIGTSAAGCSSNMTGSGTVTINPLPIIYNVTGGGGYCAGTVTGVHIGLASSNSGISYQLMNGLTAVGAPVPGAGAAIDFGTFTAIGTYTVKATNSVTGCINTMSGSAVVSINALPTVFSMTSNGSYCLGGPGVVVGTTGSTPFVNYQLYKDGVPVAGPMVGTGAGLTFGSETVAGTYTAIATNPATGCSSPLAGSSTVTINPLPTVYTVTGGGAYCSGGTGVPVGLSASTIGTNYQLYYNFVASGLPIAGNGSALSFGLQTAPGNYTVVAINPITNCTNNMSGIATVFINPPPAFFIVTGGGNYCSGGTGVNVGLSGSSIGVNYQLYTATLPVGVPLAGTGLPLNFGLQTASGVYTVVATNAALGCIANMVGSATITVNPLPTVYTVTGGGSHCPGDAGVPVGLSGSTSGTLYQLYMGATPMGAPVPGTGTAITFGLQTVSGTYTVAATTSATTCAGQMTGTATVSLYPLPLVYNVTGGGNYCPSGSGVAVGTDGSSLGNNYQLYLNLLPVGTVVAGTGLPISFGLQTAAGNYTVSALNPTTGCSSNMTGSAAVGIYALPTTYNVTGGGSYCNGTGGLHAGLSGSDMGTSYQLFRGVFPIGAALPGTGINLDFGAQTIAGNYTIVATSGTTTCSNTMSGSAVITVNPLPTPHTVTGGGNYCSGTTGVTIGLNTSDTGIYYQLLNGASPAGAPVAGTGSAISFGPQTMAGTYTVKAINSATSCMNTMIGSAVVAINGLPTAYSVTGGGNYCPGATGVAVGTSGSDAGINYQLYRDGAILGAPVAGTGSALNFGMQTVAGAYSVGATNTVTGCTNNMTDTVTVGINTLPATFSIFGAHSNYCAGGAGVDLTLSGSESGVNYQLYVGGTPTGAPFAGTGFIMDLGLQTTAGNYTVIATNTTTGCSRLMSSSFSIAIDPLPTPYSVIGGGDYCSGGTGVVIGLNNSHLGITYQLYRNGTIMVGAPVMGSSFAISFGLQTDAGAYTVIATNPASTCTNNMSGSALVTIDPLPTMYTVSGGGNYCSGGAGLHVNLSGSNTGITYQLNKDGSLVGGPAAGTGLAIDFGAQTAAGNYTVTATNTSTGCTNTMAGSVNIGINSLPTSYIVTGGGSYCSGGSGVAIGLMSSSLNINYQLYNGLATVGAPMPGTGSAINFGLQTAAGTYKVVATNTLTTCTNNMSGTKVITVNALPSAHNVIGGGNYCAGTGGVHIGLDGSNTDIQYQLYLGMPPTGSPIIGVGGLLDFGMFTGAGVYTVVASNTATGCSSNMPGSATVGVTTPVSPSITISTGLGDTLCAGNLIAITALVSNQGSAPTYNWTVNGLPASAIGTSYTYMPSDGDVVVATLHSNAACATPTSVSSTPLSLTVLPSGTPSITIATDHGDTVCQGTVVNFATTSTTFGGSNPTYSWLVNGINQSSEDHYSYIPGNNDVVYCVLGSNYQCRSANSAPSNHITMTVDAPVVPDVTVTAHPGANIVTGEMVTISATLNNNVPAPTYQWFVNGSPIAGATMPAFIGNNFKDMDSVSCVVTSGGVCAGNNGANSVILHVFANVHVGQVAASTSDITVVPNPSKGIFIVKGTLGTTNDEEVSLEVTDLLGQVIYNSKVTTHGGNINERIQVTNNIANGMYILNLRSANENKVFHIVIEQ